jgi:hypothetical protein
MHLRSKSPLFALGITMSVIGLLRPPAVSQAAVLNDDARVPVESFIECSTCIPGFSSHYERLDCCVPGTDFCVQCDWSFPNTCHANPVQDICGYHHSPCAET